MGKSKLSTTSKIVILAAFYFVAALLGEVSSFMHGAVTLVWPPFGLGLAAIVLFGMTYWPAVALGTFFYCLLHWQSVGTLVAEVVGNCSQE